jgi:hypothetical protein
MRFVVYDHDSLEPLTVVHLPGDVIGRLKTALRDGGSPILRVPLPGAAAEAGEVAVETSWVELCLEYWYRPAIPTYQPVPSIVTHQPEDALKLRAVFLAGQQKEVREARERAFAEGLRAALDKRSGP